MKDTFNLPNVLTYIRMLLIPVFAVLFFTVDMQPNYFALGVFVLASLTDALDGFIARRYKLETNIGKVLDPLADKMLKITVLVCFVIEGVIPAWFVIVMLVLDLSLVVSASILFKREIIIKSNYLGKAGTLIITVGVIMSFFHTYLNNINLYVMYLGLLTVLISVFSYLSIYLKIKNKNNKI